MTDLYFRELDPVKRKMILDKKSEDGDAASVKQLKKLFAIRYRADNKGNYADLFLRSWLELKLTAENLDGFFVEKKNRRTAKAALKSLCLDEASEFPPELMYREMCQLAATYLAACSEDSHYTAVLLGLGKKTGKKIRDKMILDLERIGETLPERLQMEQEFAVLRAAIRDVKKLYLSEQENPVT